MTSESAIIPKPKTYNQARIRVNEDGATMLYTLLRTEEERLLLIRQARKQDSVEYDEYQREIAIVRRVIAEVERVLDEQGWEP